MEPIIPREKVTNNGTGLTQGLFYEFRFQSCNDNPPYNLKEYDHRGTLSMYKVYISCESEYEAALKILGSWPHWKKLCKKAWFKPYIESWREEREIKEAALGKKILIEKAEEGNVSAAKELFNQTKAKKGPGRPSNKEKEDDTQKQKAIDQKVVSLLQRVDDV